MMRYSALIVLPLSITLLSLIYPVNSTSISHVNSHVHDAHKEVVSILRLNLRLRALCIRHRFSPAIGTVLRPALCYLLTRLLLQRIQLQGLAGDLQAQHIIHTHHVSHVAQSCIPCLTMVQPSYWRAARPKSW